MSDITIDLDSNLKLVGIARKSAEMKHVPSPPHYHTRPTILRGAGIVFAIGIWATLVANADERDLEDSATVEHHQAPESTGEEKFAALLQDSPFLRRLDLSRSLVLTGSAQIEGDPFAVVHDRETEKSHFVSGVANSLGWKLLAIEGDHESLETVTARIAVTGGQTVTIGYDPRHLKPGEQIGLNVPADQAARVTAEARNYRRGLSSDGFPREPPRDLVEKMSKMSVEQRSRIIHQMNQHRAKGLGGQERQKIFRNLVDRAAQQRR